MKTINCILCGSPKYREIFAIKDTRFHSTNDVFHLVKCQKCGLIYLNPFPNENEIGKFYPQKIYILTKV